MRHHREDLNQRYGNFSSKREAREQYGELRKVLLEVDESAMEALPES